MKILVHHHCKYYLESDKCYMPSFIGVWISEMAKHFQLVGFVGIQSFERSEKFDYCINSAQNIKFFPINTFKIFNLGFTKFSIPNIEQINCLNFDILIIRGMTPLQYFIYKKFSGLTPVFFLVGSLIDSKPKIRLNKINLIQHFYYWLRIYQLKIISRKAMILANSPQIVEELKSVLKINSCFVPTNSLKLSDFTPNIKNRFSVPTKVLFCGRVTKDKGIEELLFAIKLIIDLHYKIKLRVVGNIERKYFLHLKNLVKELNIADVVDFQGFVPFGENLFSIYRKSDIYVLPSWHEGFPHSIWEAACNYTPIVTTNVGGIPGIINSNFVNFIEVNNPESIKNAVVDCVDNYEEKFNKAALLFDFAKSFTIEACVLKLRNEIENI